MQLSYERTLFCCGMSHPTGKNAPVQTSAPALRKSYCGAERRGGAVCGNSKLKFWFRPGQTFDHFRQMADICVIMIISLLGIAWRLSLMSGRDAITRYKLNARVLRSQISWEVKKQGVGERSDTAPEYRPLWERI